MKFRREILMLELSVETSRSPAEFYASHNGLSRLTNDLALFTLDKDVFAHCDSVVRDAARELEAEVSAIRTYPHFRRYHLQREAEGLEIDLVCEVAPQISREKTLTDGVRVDPLDEIAVNKVCAVVGRAEVRDLWDLYQLLRRGYDLDTLVDLESQKDGGVSPESLAYVLSGLNWQALQGAADRVELDGFDDVARYFQQQTERLALRLLPPS